MMKQSPQIGFTLIELSIVLVVIGLIVGGILVGQDLVKAAELRAFVSQIEKLNTAFNTFKSKYDCIPGDCANVTDFFPNLLNGNGDGFIDGCYTAGDDNQCDGYGYNGSYNYFTEGAFTWSALSQAGLIPGQYDPTSSAPGVGYPYVANQPASGILVGLFQGKNWFRTGLTVGTGPIYGLERTGYAPYSPTSSNTFPFTPAEAASIDGKIDDGTPTGGHIAWLSYCNYNCFILNNLAVQALGGYDYGDFPTSDGPLGANSPYCYNSATNQFNNGYKSKICNFAIPGNF